MKRFWILLLALFLPLCACGRDSLLHRDEPPAWAAKMQATVELRTDTAQFTARWTYAGGQSTFTLRSPQDVDGVTLVCGALESRIESGGVQADLPEQSAFVQLDRAYRAVCDLLVVPMQTQEGWLYDGTDRYGFEALGTDDGTLRIRFPRLGAEAECTVTPTETNIE